MEVLILSIFLLSMGKEDIEKISETNNKFSFELYFKLKTKKENIFFSPFSIYNAFLMLYEGARENTKEEIENLFGFPVDENIRREGFKKILDELNKKDKKYELHIANALWVQKNYKILEEYLEINKKYYSAEIQNVDFINEPEKSSHIINSWVFEKTKGRIKDLISKDLINYRTRLILTNAIYFKGKWLLQFDKERTKEADFNISENERIKVQMMEMEGARFNYYEDEKVQVLEIPYDGEEISMFIFLPKSFNIDSLDKYLNCEKIEEIKNKFVKEKVNVYIPKFKIETKYFLEEILYEMGLRNAFANGADFSGITGRKELFISKVIHKAFVEVNEEGTEAAAATGIVVELTMAKPVKIFKVDHPFVFIIYDKKYGNILFFGRVINPS